MLIHTIFDLTAWLAAWAIGSFIARRGTLAGARTPASDPGYFIALGLGAIAGALVFGSSNMTLAGIGGIGHSIAGAVAGGIVAVELFKWWNAIQGSTGGQFVAPLAIGIAVGRWGCFLAGLPDYTYGVATTLPWASISGMASRGIRCSSTNRPPWRCFSGSTSTRSRMARRFSCDTVSIFS
jgi:phosphatidylglycerol---prolipoprotein diacylglyceryl transferase